MSENNKETLIYGFETKAPEQILFTGLDISRVKKTNEIIVRIKAYSEDQRKVVTQHLNVLSAETFTEEEN